MEKHGWISKYHAKWRWTIQKVTCFINSLMWHFGKRKNIGLKKKADQWSPGVDFREGVDYKGDIMKEFGYLRVLYLDCGGVYMIGCICLNS